MREIKFRAWDKKRREWCTDIECDGLELASYSNIYYSQFTGLVDKQGNDIYEGDIVNKRYVKKPLMYKQENTYEVSWGAYSDGEYVDNVECWVADGSPISDEGGMFGEARHTFEVVGNKYENPELLDRK